MPFGTITDPVLIIAIVAALIVLAPLLLSRWRVPGMVVLLLAGAALGPNGLAVLARDRSIELLGTVGLLFIMFTAALEVDMVVLKRSRKQTSVFGVLTFLFPMVLGSAGARWVLGFDWPATFLFASLLASHTLLAYPIVARLGLTNNRAVSTALGGTILTDTAALLVLAVVVGASEGEITSAFWVRLGLSITAYVLGVLVVIPRLARWFFRVVRPDGTSEFAFVLAVIFGVASLSHAAGVEPIVGAFLAGLALNSSIPHGSPLMNRINFTGEAIFVPFFLLSVGMLLDVRVFASGWGSWLSAIVMVVAVTSAKYLAAFFTGRIFSFQRDETGVLFGLSLAQAAATLAAVLVGFDLGIFDESVLNGAIVTMLVTCIIAPWLVDRHGRRLAASAAQAPAARPAGVPAQRLLVALASPKLAEPLSDLALLLRDPKQNQPIVPATVILDSPQAEADKAAADKTLARAVAHFTAADVPSQPVTRVDVNVVSALRHLQSARGVTDIIIGWSDRPSTQQRLSGTFLDHLLADEPRYAIWVARLGAPLGTTARVHFVVPPLAVLEPGFAATAASVKHLAHAAGASITLWAEGAEVDQVGAAFGALHPAVEFDVRPVDAFARAAAAVAEAISVDDLIVVYAARQGSLSWNAKLRRLAHQVGALAPSNNLIAVYPAAQPATAGEAAAAPADPGQLPLFAPDRIVLGLDAPTPEEALTRLLARASALTPEAAAALVAPLVASAVPVEGGAVLLHAYGPPDLPTTLLVGRSEHGLALGGPGAAPTHLVLALLHPTDKDPQAHLDLLAELVRRLHTPDLIAKVRAAASPEQVCELLSAGPAEPARVDPRAPAPSAGEFPRAAPTHRPATPPARLTLPSDKAAAAATVALYGDLDRATRAFKHELADELAAATRDVADELERLTLRGLQNLQRVSRLRAGARRAAACSSIETNAVAGIGKLVEGFEDGHTPLQREALLSGLTTLSTRLREACDAVAHELLVAPPDAAPRRRPRPRKVPARQHVAAILAERTPAMVDEALDRLGRSRARALSQLTEIVGLALGELSRAAAQVAEARPPGAEDDGAAGAAAVEAARARVQERLLAWRAEFDLALTAEAEACESFAREVAQALSDVLRHPKPPRPKGRRSEGAGFVAVSKVVQRHGANFDRLTYLLTRSRLEGRLQAMHLALRDVVRRTRADLDTRIEGTVLAEVAAFRGSLEALARALEEHREGPLGLSGPPLATSFDDRGATARLLEALEKVSVGLPEQVELLLGPVRAAGTADGAEPQPMTIAVRRLVTSVIDTDLVAALQPALARVAQATDEASEIARDVHRVLAFEVDDPAEVTAFDDERLELAQQGLARIDAAAERIRAAWAELGPALDACLRDVQARTRADEIASPTGRFQRFVEVREPRTLGGRLVRAARSMRDGTRRAMVEGLYAWNRNVVLARTLQAEAGAEETSRVERILELRRTSAPGAEVEAKLPIVYRQIFTGRPSSDPAYWLGMADEVRRARDAFAAHAGGHAGAMLVTGPPGSGRTALALRMLTELPERTPVFHLYPPEGGSIEPLEFDNALVAALRVQIPVDQALGTVPPGSVVVVHDLELWWERSPTGLRVLERLSELIEAYGDRCLFVLIAGEPFVRLFSRLTPLGDQLLATVRVRPLDAHQLREAVMRRHEATGLKLRLAGDDREPNEWKLARVFSGLSAHTGGYAGPALNAWIGHIGRIDGDTLVVREPRPPELAAFDALDAEWTALLVEFLVHRRMDLARLERVTALDRATLRAGLSGLRRAGLLTERASSGTYEIDRFMQHHVVRWLSHKELT